MSRGCSELSYTILELQVTCCCASVEMPSNCILLNCSWAALRIIDEVALLSRSKYPSSYQANRLISRLTSGAFTFFAMHRKQSWHPSLTSPELWGILWLLFTSSGSLNPRASEFCGQSEDPWLLGFWVCSKDLRFRPARGPAEVPQVWGAQSHPKFKGTWHFMVRSLISIRFLRCLGMPRFGRTKQSEHGKQWQTNAMALGSLFWKAASLATHPLVSSIFPRPAPLSTSTSSSSSWW